MGTLTTLAVVLTLASEAYKAGLEAAEKQAESSSSSITSTLSQIGAGITVGGVALVGGALVEMGKFMGDSVTAAMGAQDAQVQLESVLKNTGATTGVTEMMVEGLADDLKGLTKFSYTSVEAAGAVVARFKTISSDTFPAAMQAAADLATSMGTDLPSAALMLGKMLDDPGQALARLKMAGVDVSQAFKDQVKAMADAGDTAGAQKLILDALTGSIGGVAQAAGKTASGELAIFHNMIESTEETIGAGLLPVISNLAAQVTDWIESPAVVTGINQFADGIANLAQQAITFIPVAISWFQQIGAWFMNNQGVIIGILVALGVAVGVFVYTTVIPAAIAAITAMAPIILILAAVGVAVYLLYQAWTTNFGGIQQIVASVTAWIQTTIQNFLAAVKDFWDAHGAAIMATAKAMWDGVMAVVNWFIGQFKLIFSAFQDAFSGNWTGFGEKLRQVWDNAWQAIKNAASVAWEWLKAEVPKVIAAIGDFFKNTDWMAIGTAIIHGIASGITAAWDWLKNAVVDAAKAALDAAKGFLGIKSPSTVFAGVGENLMQGWAQGITKNIALPVNATLMAAGGVSHASTTNFNLTINGGSVPENVAQDFMMMRSLVSPGV